MPTSPSDRGGPGSTPSLRWVRPALAVVLLVQLVILYVPAAPSVGPVTWTDKVVHGLAFGVPAALMVLGRARRWWLVALVLHAPLSEVVQHVLLPNRSGDPADVVADLGGVLLGGLAAVVWRRARRW